MDFLNHPITNTQFIWGSIVFVFVWIASIVVSYIVGFGDGADQTEQDYCYHGD